MKKHDIVTPVIIIGIGIVAFLLLRRKNLNIQNTATAPETAPGNQFINDPVESAYSPNLAPQVLGGGTIDVNIANQGLQYLSDKYIPLFGFVGMAQGETYH